GREEVACVGAASHRGIVSDASGGSVPEEAVSFRRQRVMGENLAGVSPPFPSRRTTAVVLAFAMLFPLASAWLHYLALARGGSKVNPVQQIAYLAGKVIQFGLPVVFLVAVERRRPRLTGRASMACCRAWGSALRRQRSCSDCISSGCGTRRFCGKR